MTACFQQGMVEHHMQNTIYLQWEREGIPRGFNYHDRQAARERSDFPVAKRGRRETSPGYPSYRDASSSMGPAFPTGPRERFEGSAPLLQALKNQGLHPYTVCPVPATEENLQRCSRFPLSMACYCLIRHGRITGHLNFVTLYRCATCATKKKHTCA